MVHDALQKRSAYLDAFANGLDVFGLKCLISLFPEVCKPAFVWDGKIRPLQVASMMNPIPTIKSMDPNQKRIWEYLMKFVDSAEEAGEIILCGGIRTELYQYYILCMVLKLNITL